MKAVNAPEARWPKTVKTTGAMRVRAPTSATASLTGTAVLVSKLWDAITAPVMGVISDNTRTRFGRRRPYSLAGIGLVFVSFALMWAPVTFSRQWADFAWYLAAYILFSTVYTMVWVPYNSIAAELTPDYDERTRLSLYRMIFSNLSGIIAAIAPREPLREHALRRRCAAGVALGRDCLRAFLCAALHRHLSHLSGEPGVHDAAARARGPTSWLRSRTVRSAP